MGWGVVDWPGQGTEEATLVEAGLSLNGRNRDRGMAALAPAGRGGGMPKYYSTQWSWV